MVSPNTAAPHAVGVVHVLLPVSQAARHCGISGKLFRAAAARGQLGSVQLLQVGQRQYVHGGALFDFLEESKKAKA
ncbi:hypothetical protein J7E70_30230 [Variovorax paradoxus]|nr:hypothetical protein [Variovorax paradoxus]MBT2304700.1 hypothetical protein [Variovorax paradoxus]